MVGMMVEPSPRPTTNSAAPSATYPVSGPIPVYTAMPARASPIPAGTTRPAPSRSVSAPATGIAHIAPNPCGTSKSPVASGDSPRTTW